MGDQYNYYSMILQIILGYNLSIKLVYTCMIVLYYYIHAYMHSN